LRKKGGGVKGAGITGKTTKEGGHKSWKKNEKKNSLTPKTNLWGCEAACRIRKKWARKCQEKNESHQYNKNRMLEDPWKKACQKGKSSPSTVKRKKVRRRGRDQGQNNQNQKGKNPLKKIVA